MSTLKKKGFDIYAVAIPDKTAPLIEEEFRFIPLSNLNRKGKNPLKDLKLLFELYKIYKYYKPALVLHFTIKPNIYGNIACRLSRINSISSVTGLGTVFQRENLLTWLVKKLNKIAFSHSKMIFFQNNEDMAVFNKEKILSTDKYVITPGSGVNTSYFSPEYCAPCSKDKKSTFLLIARMLWNKGIGEFVEAAKIVKQKYPNTNFCLLGAFDFDNPSSISEKVIKSWVADGFVNYYGETSDVRPFIFKSDIIVLPSYYREGIPRSLIEAAAMGKPIITTDNIGCKEVVDDGENGFLVPIKNQEALSKAMIKFINLPQSNKIEMGKNSRKKAINKFDEELVINKYLNVINEILEEK